MIRRLYSNLSNYIFPYRMGIYNRFVGENKGGTPVPPSNIYYVYTFGEYYVNLAGDYYIYS